MKKQLKRVLAFNLAVLMVLTSGISSPAFTVRAIAAAVGTEAASESEQETTAAETTQSETETGTETETQTEAEGSSEVSAPEGDDTGAVTEPEPSTEPSAEPVFETQVYVGFANGLYVTVTDTNGAFPVGSRMVVTAVPESQVRGQIEEAMEQGVKKVKAVDISFYAPDDDTTPLEPNGIVDVQIEALSTEISSSNLSVAHIADDGNVTVMEDAEIDGATANFGTDAFSIYAVVQTGEDARLLVKFVQPNGTVIDSMYVKQGDTMEQVLYDPGVGEMAAGVYFRGWTTDAAFTTDTLALTIAGVREAVTALVNGGVTDGQTVTYYAMEFKDYRITYYDAKDISLGQEEVTFRADAAAAQSYTVNMAYTVPSDTQHFEGWNVKEGGSNIAGFETGKVYQNNDVITITGDVKFAVNAPEGHWFIFDENGKGATYNAPQFVYSADKPTRPNDANMTRNGYTFGGWFADKATADQTSGGTQYDFNQTLSDKTTVYARWISKTTAGYTIIIWKQNLSGNGYDFEESIPLTGTVGATINVVTQQGSGNNAYARVNGTNKQYTGFHLKEFDQNVKIKTEGNAVVNVYYDRNEHTLTFQEYDFTYTATTSNNGTQYGLVNGEYVQLTRHGWGSSYYWTYGDSWISEGTRYTGTRYTRSNRESWQTIKSITALYGQSIGNNFPIVGSNGVTYNEGQRWMPQSSTLFDDVIVFLDTMPNESITFHVDTNTHTTRTMRYYVEVLPGETPAITFQGKGFSLTQILDISTETLIGWISQDIQNMEVTRQTGMIKAV